MNLALLGWLNPFGDGLGKLRWLLALVLVLLLGAGLWSASSTAFGRAIGLDNLQYRAQMLGNAGFWAYRAYTGNTVPGEVSAQYRGYVDKGQRSFLLVYLYDGAGRKRQVVTLANVNNATVNLANFADRYRGKALRFDLFILPTEKYPRALLWDLDSPLNLDVIEEGGGPDINPPTNIVDWIFARYYWHEARKGL
jgi:hypothetical protein